MLAAINFIKMLSQVLLVLRNKGVAEVEVLHDWNTHFFLMCRRGFKADMSYSPFLPSAFQKRVFPYENSDVVLLFLLNIYP